MIFKKIKDIYRLNEDFDFGSIEVVSSAASEYNATPEMVRTQLMADIKPCTVLLALYNYKPTPIMARYTHKCDRAGNVQTKESSPNFHCCRFDFYKFPPAQRQLLKTAGFKELEYKRGDVPEWLAAFVADFTGGVINPEGYNCVNYVLSPDGGIAIITSLYLIGVKMPDGSAENFEAEHIPYFMFTGDVIYTPKDVEPEMIKAGKQNQSLIQRPMKFLEAIGQRVDLVFDPNPISFLVSGVAPSGHLVFGLTSENNPDNLERFYKILTGFEYDEYNDESIWAAETITSLTKWPRKRRIENSHCILFKYGRDRKGAQVTVGVEDNAGGYFQIYKTTDRQFLE